MKPVSDMAMGGAAARPQRRWLQPLAALVGTLLLSGLLVVLPIDVERWGHVGYLGVFVLTLLSSATILIPSAALGAALTFGAAATLNPLLVGVLAGLAAGLGEITGYLAGRSGAELARVRQRSSYRRIAGWVERYGAWPVLLLAALPLPLIDLAGLAAGALGMPFWRFLSACVLGKTIRFVPVALLGAWLRTQGWL